MCVWIRDGNNHNKIKIHNVKFLFLFCNSPFEWNIISDFFLLWAKFLSWQCLSYLSKLSHAEEPQLLRGQWLYKTVYIALFSNHLTVGARNSDGTRPQGPQVLFSTWNYYYLKNTRTFIGHWCLSRFSSSRPCSPHWIWGETNWLLWTVGMCFYYILLCDSLMAPFLLVVEPRAARWYHRMTVMSKTQLELLKDFSFKKML